MNVIVTSMENQVDLSGVSQDALAEMANSAAENVERNLQSAVQSAITAGRALIAAKKQCKHGEWLPWLKKNWRFSAVRATQYIQLANHNSSYDLTSATSISEALRMIADSKAEAKENEPKLFDEPVDLVFEDNGFACATCNASLDQPAKHCDDCGEHFTGERCECATAVSYDEESIVESVLQNATDEFEIETRQLATDVEVVEVTLKEQTKNYYTANEWDAVKLSASDFQSDKTFNKQDTTSIEWARWSWNPITGCKHDCPYCYARDIANRFYPQKFEPSIYPERFACPANTKVPSEAATDTSYKNVFTGSMADIFGRWVPLSWIDLVFQTVTKSPQWNFLFLTKFPQRVVELSEIPANAWIGTSVDCQDRVANAEKAFAKMGGGIKWLSIEPMLTPLRFKNLGLFDWVVIGGASKSSTTPKWVPPMDWLVDMHIQARDAGCAIYYKDNLDMGGDLRIREFPWEKRKEKLLPEQLKYLNIA